MSDKQVVAEPAAAGKAEAAVQLEKAAAAAKCWPCGCLHSTLTGIERAVPADQQSDRLKLAIREAVARLQEVKYECLGCEVCYPALAANALNHAAAGLLQVETCPTEKPAERQGWPPLPGAYRVLRYRAPVAVCTLTDTLLMESVAERAGGEVAIVGTLQTENLGVERLILNVLTNPNIRFLVLCGPDSRQAIGHLPGQSLLALAQAGLDDRGRIIGAPGKRPVIRNAPREAVEHFRRTVQTVNLIGETEVTDVLEAARRCARENRGPAEPYAAIRAIQPIRGYFPERMVSDPAGYFVIYLDRARMLLVLEHYQNNGVLDVVIEAPDAAELYVPAVEERLVSRLDHAAYLGRELARAEECLRSGANYVQDAAPERRAGALANGYKSSPSRSGVPAKEPLRNNIIR